MIENPFNKPLSIDAAKKVIGLKNQRNDPAVVPKMEEMDKAKDVNPPKVDDRTLSIGTNPPTAFINTKPDEPQIPVLSKNTERKHEDSHAQTCEEILKAYNNMESDIPLNSNYWYLKSEEIAKNKAKHMQ